MHDYICVFVVFRLNRYFYPTTSVHPVFDLILHPRKMQMPWSQTVRHSKPNSRTSSRQVKCASVPGTRTQQNTSQAVHKNKKRKKREREKEKKEQKNNQTNKHEQILCFKKIRTWYFFFAPKTKKGQSTHSHYRRDKKMTAHPFSFRRVFGQVHPCTLRLRCVPPGSSITV